MPQDIISIRNEIKAEIAKSGWTLTDIVKEINKLHPDNTTTSQNISNKLTRGTLKYSEAREIAFIIGCKIEWVPAANMKKHSAAVTNQATGERMERDTHKQELPTQHQEPPTQTQEPTAATAAYATPVQSRTLLPDSISLEEAAAKIDLKRLPNDILYQMDIAEALGTDALAALLEKARQQLTESKG